MRSDAIKKGASRAPARAMFKAMGLASPEAADQQDLFGEQNSADVDWMRKELMEVLDILND